MPNEDVLSRVMSSPVKTIDASDTVGTAAEIMVKNEIGAVIVLEGKNPVGIITERDIVKQVVRANDALEKPVKQQFSKPLVTGRSNTTIQEAFETMLKNRIRRLPVIDNGKLIGIVTEKDLMRWVLRVSYEPNIPPHIKAVLDTL